jgi:hypothetical protein
MLMYELSLDRAHRLQLDRPAFFDGRFYRLIGGCAQSRRSP